MKEKKTSEVVAQSLFAANDKKKEPLKIVIEVTQPWTVKNGKGSVLTLIQQKISVEKIIELDDFFSGSATYQNQHYHVISTTLRGYDNYQSVEEFLHSIIADYIKSTDNQATCTLHINDSFDYTARLLELRRKSSEEEEYHQNDSAHNLLG